MSVKSIFTRAVKAIGSGRNQDTEDFIRNNPDCPRHLRNEFIQAQAGRPGFSPQDFHHRRSLELIALSL